MWCVILQCGGWIKAFDMSLQGIRNFLGQRRSEKRELAVCEGWEGPQGSQPTDNPWHLGGLADLGHSQWGARCSDGEPGEYPGTSHLVISAHLGVVSWLIGLGRAAVATLEKAKGRFERSKMAQCRVAVDGRDKLDKVVWAVLREMDNVRLAT